MTWRSWRYCSAPSSPLWSSLCSIDWETAARGWLAGLVTASVFVLLSTGCACGSLPPVAPPGEPRMVLEAQGKVRLATFDEAAGEFVDLGWHDAAGLRGWTIADYEWKP